VKFIELYVVLAFAVAWGILEWVARSFDKPARKARDEPTTAARDQAER